MGRRKKETLSNSQILNSVVGYCRVSTREQADEGVSLSAQKNRIERFVEDKNLNLVQIIMEEGVSGSTPLKKRDGAKKLIELLQQNKAKMVVATKLDRLFRDALDCLTTLKEWEDMGVKIFFLDMGIDFTTATGKAFLTTSASFAELERNLISERTKDGLEQVKKEGVRLGGESWGWKRIDSIDGKGRFRQVVIVEELEVIQKIKDLRSEGYTYQLICDTLSADGVKTKKGGKWWPMTVKKICEMDLSFLDNIDDEDDNE